MPTQPFRAGGHGQKTAGAESADSRRKFDYLIYYDLYARESSSNLIRKLNWSSTFAKAQNKPTSIPVSQRRRTADIDYVLFKGRYIRTVILRSNQKLCVVNK